MNSGPLLLAVQCLSTQEKMLLLAGDSLVLGRYRTGEGKKGGIAGPKMNVPQAPIITAPGRAQW